MKLELNQQECQNIKVALLTTAKRPEVGENEMTALLVLAQKFNWVDLPPKTAKEEKSKKD